MQKPSRVPYPLADRIDSAADEVLAVIRAVEHFPDELAWIAATAIVLRREIAEALLRLEARTAGSSVWLGMDPPSVVFERSNSSVRASVVPPTRE